MNIFVLDTDPEVAAKYHNNKHVVKMILESAQLLCGAHRLCGENPDERLYKLTHKNHPCAKWVRESSQNYDWLYSLFIALSHEYTFRYDKQHKSFLKFAEILQNQPDLPDKPISNFALAMPEVYHENDSVAAYRNYYIKEKAHIAQWTKRERPNWYV